MEVVGGLPTPPAVSAKAEAAIIHAAQSAADPPMPATTTTEDNRKTAGQRRVNLVWEVTQAAIAIIVTLAVIYTTIKGIESVIIANAFTLIVALYYVRTNHVKTGGVGGTDQPR